MPSTPVIIQFFECQIIDGPVFHILIDSLNYQYWETYLTSIGAQHILITLNLN
jgi:hypothetical protein